MNLLGVTCKNCKHLYFEKLKNEIFIPEKHTENIIPLYSYDAVYKCKHPKRKNKELINYQVVSKRKCKFFEEDKDQAAYQAMKLTVTESLRKWGGGELNG